MYPLHLCASALTQISYFPYTQTAVEVTPDPDPVRTYVGGEVDDWEEEWPTSTTTEAYEGDAFDVEPLGDGSSAEDEGLGEGPPGACLAEDEMLDSPQVDALINKLLEELEDSAHPADQGAGPGEGGGQSPKKARSRRKKRKVLKDFKVNRWDTTIPYMIDGDFCKLCHIFCMI